MDYMFYTPPNTEPDLDHSVPFDQDLALLEGRHHMKTQEIAGLQAQLASDPDLPNGTEIDQAALADLKRSIMESVNTAQADLAALEQQIADARKAKQTEWDEIRAAAAAKANTEE